MSIKGVLFALTVLVLVSCKPYNLVGEKFFASNQEKIVSIEFVNDTLCNVSQWFSCDKLPEEYRNIEFKATYKVEKMKLKTYDSNFKPTRFKTDILIVNNLECVDCKRYKEIPNYFDLNCATVIDDDKLKEKIKYGIIYNLVNDTLIIDKGQIMFGGLKLKPK